MNQQPKHCIVLKVIWSISLFIAIVGSVWFFSSAFTGKFNYYPSIAFIIIPVFLTALSVILVFGLFPKAFEPELKKMKMKKDLYIQSETKEMLEDFLSTDADINHRSIKKRARSVKQGLSVENCPKCGDKVDANENFCNKCGAPLYAKCNKCKTVNEAGDDFCRNCGNKLNKQ